MSAPVKYDTIAPVVCIRVNEHSSCTGNSCTNYQQHCSAGGPADINAGNDPSFFSGSYTYKVPVDVQVLAFDVDSQGTACQTDVSSMNSSSQFQVNAAAVGTSAPTGTFSADPTGCANGDILYYYYQHSRTMSGGQLPIYIHA